MERIKIWENEVPCFKEEYGQEAPALIPFLLKDGNLHPCVIIFPGGGYRAKVMEASERLAVWLNTLGYQAFILDYRVKPYTYPAILGDALRSIRFVRYYAEKFMVNSRQICTLGFSAGGHLAAMTVFRHKDAVLCAGDPVDAESSRPDAAVLCYAPLSFVKHPHMGTVDCFLGEEKSWEMRRSFSAEEVVTEDAPPLFLWHTAEDEKVPVENSLYFALELQKKRIPFSMHIYPRGLHGEFLVGEDAMAVMWKKDCAAWLKEVFQP